jgi:mycothiol synthase
MLGDVTDQRRTLPRGYTIRPGKPDDRAAVAALLRRVDAHEYGESAFGPDFISDDWDRPEFDPRTDAVVVETGDGIVGFGQTLEEAPGIVEGLGLVHPNHRGLGIGSLLADAAERRTADLAARAGGSMVLRSSVSTPDAAAHTLLAARGYQRVRSFFHMDVDLSQDTAIPPDPPDVALRGFASGDEPAAHATIEAAFAGSWGFHPLTYQEFTERIVGREFEPGLSVMAERQGEAVGVLLGRPMDGLGWVDMLAVLPAWRGRGIGGALLQASFVRFRDHGLPRAMLNVDSENEAGAVRLYERVGMRVRRQWDLYEKVVQGRP